MLQNRENLAVLGRDRVRAIVYYYHQLPPDLKPAYMLRIRQRLQLPQQLDDQQIINAIQIWLEDLNENER